MLHATLLHASRATGRHRHILRLAVEIFVSGLALGALDAHRNGGVLALVDVFNAATRFFRSALFTEGNGNSLLGVRDLRSLFGARVQLSAAKLVHNLLDLAALLVGRLGLLHCTALGIADGTFARLTAALHLLHHTALAVADRAKLAALKSASSSVARNPINRIADVVISYHSTALSLLHRPLGLPNPNDNHHALGGFLNLATLGEHRPSHLARRALGVASGGGELEVFDVADSHGIYLSYSPTCEETY